MPSLLGLLGFFGAAGVAAATAARLKSGPLRECERSLLPSAVAVAAPAMMPIMPVLASATRLPRAASLATRPLSPSRKDLGSLGLLVLPPGPVWPLAALSFRLGGGVGDWTMDSVGEGDRGPFGPF